MSKTRFVIPATLALAAALAGGVAHARDADVQWSVTIGSPGYPQPKAARMMLADSATPVEGGTTEISVSVTVTYRIA